MGNEQSTIANEDGHTYVDLAAREAAAEKRFLEEHALHLANNSELTPKSALTNSQHSRETSPQADQLLQSFKPRKEPVKSSIRGSAEQSPAASHPYRGQTSAAQELKNRVVASKKDNSAVAPSFPVGNSISKASSAQPSLSKRLPQEQTNGSAKRHRPTTSKNKGSTSQKENPPDASSLPVRNNSAANPTAPSLAKDSPVNTTTAQKHRASSNAFTDERRLSYANLPKIAKRTSIASPRSPQTKDNQPLTAVGDERPPVWYKDLQVKNARGRDSGDVDILLQSLRTQIARGQSSGAIPQTVQTQIRDKLHKVVFREVTPSMLKSNRMLHDADGLPQLFDQKFSKGVDWPFDIRADAHELYNKWCRCVFDIHLFRGISFKVKTAESKKEGHKTTDSIDPDYPTVSAKYHGNGDLQIGQWWPTQLCALRDGAHGVSQGGISGRVGEGAFSCIMSGGHDYPDVDEGNVVLYCGTDSTDGNVTEYTQRMIESSEGNQPVRVIRSHNLEGPYAPVLGFRYDGLYDVVSFERLDPENSKRQRHRFRLVRQPNQDPIRGGSGPERRPTEEEVQEYRKHMKNAGKAVGKV